MSFGAISEYVSPHAAVMAKQDLDLLTMPNNFFPQVLRTL